MRKGWLYVSWFMLAGMALATTAASFLNPILWFLAAPSGLLAVALSSTVVQRRPKAVESAGDPFQHYLLAKRNQRVQLEHDWLVMWLHDLPAQHAAGYRSAIRSPHSTPVTREIGMVGLHRHEGVHHCGIIRANR